MKLDDVKENLSSMWTNVAEGWRHLWQSAAGALTRFKPGEKSQLPASREVDSDFYLPTQGWAMLGSDLFEDEHQLVVRLELPGMEKEDIDVEVLDDALVVSGEKRFEREGSEGRWRVMQCAYGRFRRVVPLPVPVEADKARARYRNGVLRIELPKSHPGRPRTVTLQVD